MNFPVPISIFDHRFVRPNYAQRRRRFSLLELLGPTMIFCSTAASAKRLAVNEFSTTCPEWGQASENQVRRPEFPKG
jgi:hypothetical protein